MKRGHKKSVIIKHGDPWPLKRNPEYDIWLKYSSGDVSPEMEIPCDIIDILYKNYFLIKKEFGTPIYLYVPIRFRNNLLSSQSVYLHSHDCLENGDFSCWGMKIVYHFNKKEELYIEYIANQTKIYTFLDGSPYGRQEKK